MIGSIIIGTIIVAVYLAGLFTRELAVLVDRRLLRWQFARQAGRALPVARLHRGRLAFDAKVKQRIRTVQL